MGNEIDLHFVNLMLYLIENTWINSYFILWWVVREFVVQVRELLFSCRKVVGILNIILVAFYYRSVGYCVVC